MPRGRKGLAVDASVLEAALMWFEQMRRNVEEKMAEIRQRLGTGSMATGAAPSQHARRPLSAAARRRIATAQRKRWAEARAKTKPARAKRALSTAARKKIAAAQRKRWAELKKAQAKKTAVKVAAKRAPSTKKEAKTAKVAGGTA